MRPIICGQFDDVLPGHDGVWVIDNHMGIYVPFSGGAPFVTSIFGYPLGVIDNSLVCWDNLKQGVLLLFPPCKERVEIDAGIHASPYAISSYIHTALQHQIVEVEGRKKALYYSQNLWEGMVGKHQAVIIDLDNGRLSVVKDKEQKTHWVASEFSPRTIAGVGKDMFAVMNHWGECMLYDAGDVIEVPPYPESTPWRGLSICSPVFVEADTNSLVCFTPSQQIVYWKENEGWREVAPIPFVPRELIIANKNLVVVTDNCIWVQP